MKWLKDIVFSSNLKKRLQKIKNVKKENRNLSKFIGILVDENSIDSMSNLEKIIEEWRKKGKTVNAFSYVDEKELPEEKTDSFCKKEINWAGIPSGEKVEKFIDTPFDILITINPEQKKFLQYINASSIAKFKIGLDAEDLQYNNLIIDCKQSSKVQTAFKEIQITLDKLAI
jgi:hypothetical protein